MIQPRVRAVNRALLAAAQVNGEHFHRNARFGARIEPHFLGIREAHRPAVRTYG
jgi:hypothetical protein